MHVMSFCFLSVKNLLFCYPLILVANIRRKEKLNKTVNSELFIQGPLTRKIFISVNAAVP